MIVIAEGLGQFLPASYLEGVKFDDHGHLSLAQANLARTMVKAVEAEYKKRTGKNKRLTGLQLGYEARCALPHAFDVILGSQLGVGAIALVENHLDGVLISCSGQLNLSYVPFDTLVDPETLVTVVRFIRDRLRLPPPGPFSGELSARLSGSINTVTGTFHVTCCCERPTECACYLFQLILPTSSGPARRNWAACPASGGRCGRSCRRPRRRPSRSGW